MFYLSAGEPNDLAVRLGKDGALDAVDRDDGRPQPRLPSLLLGLAQCLLLI